MRAKYLVALLILLGSFGAVAMDLTGHWRESPEAIDYYIRQIDDQVWLLAEGAGHHPDLYQWTAVGHGTLIGDNLTIDYADVPKGNGTISGVIEMKVISDIELNITSWTGISGGANWTEVRLEKMA